MLADCIFLVWPIIIANPRWISIGYHDHARAGRGAMLMKQIKRLLHSRFQGCVPSNRISLDFLFEIGLLHRIGETDRTKDWQWSRVSSKRDDRHGAGPQIS